MATIVKSGFASINAPETESRGRIGSAAGGLLKPLGRVWPPLLAAIEDELIMALPIIAVCADGECREAEQANNAELVHNGRPSDARPNPFAALKAQIKKS